MTIQEALNDTRTIAATDRGTLKPELLKHITDGLNNYGGTPDGKSLDWTSDKLCDELYKKYGGLTVNEIAYIIDNGTKGNYGNDFSVSVKNILRWCSLYLFSDEYINEKRNYDRQHAGQQIDFDGAIAKRNEESLWALLRQYYDQVNAGQTIDGLPNNMARVFNFLRERGLKLADSRSLERPIILQAMEDAKRKKPLKGESKFTAWYSFSENDRAKALCLDALMRRNLVEVYNILMHRQ
jgi:hypothetical protein